MRRPHRRRFGHRKKIKGRRPGGCRASAFTGDPHLHRPEFFKVFLSDQASQRLSIPPEFVYSHNAIIPKKAILKDHSGKTWHINVEKKGSKVFFEEGWNTYVRESRLELGDFLVFTYTGNAGFSVRVYGPNGCEKKNAIVFNQNNHESHDQQEEDVKPNIATAPAPAVRSVERPPRVSSRNSDNKSIKKSEPGNAGIQESCQGKSTRYPAEAEKTLAAEEATKYVSNSEYPSLSIVMMPSYNVWDDESPIYVYL